MPRARLCAACGHGLTKHAARRGACDNEAIVEGNTFHCACVGYEAPEGESTHE